MFGSPITMRTIRPQMATDADDGGRTARPAHSARPAGPGGRPVLPTISQEHADLTGAPSWPAMIAGG
jgi:hypothetical protein